MVGFLFFIGIYFFFRLICYKNNMNFSLINSAQPKLLYADKINIEIDISNGLHSFSIVGLPDKSIEESKDRVSSAIKNSGFKSPKQQNQKVTVSLSPANLQKTGALFDVPIALGYLKSSKQINVDTDNKIFVGELSLDGKIRKIDNILPIILFAKQSGFTEIFIPHENLRESTLISGIKIYTAETLSDIIKHLDPTTNFLIPNIKNSSDTILRQKNKYSNDLDFSNIAGNEQTKRCMLIAACGGHNIGLYGSPGVGKTLMSKTFSKILPELDKEKIIDCTSIHSSIGTEQLIINPPFRSPHHTSSYSAVIGGGPKINPGEITLAHNGVLFLDEFPEFDRRVIESIRQPLEDKEIRINRSGKSEKFPANFLLIIAMNPCPCGYFKTGIKKCTCTPQLIKNYQKKLSGPIIDRIDLWSHLYKTDHDKLLEKNNSSYNNEIMSKIIKDVRKIQINRNNKLNKDLNSLEIKKFCKLNTEEAKIFNKAAKTLNLSARSYQNILKVARTIADIDKSLKIKTPHILEALQYRKQ
jgi:magnesium chelatase family protein